ncbi:MAG TPA: hypothetical protein VGT44_08690, partial [Ktedonobacteraceae bacterium]|nr:hypothetical protein [Ktedonobacteraceae bacterium]
MEDIQNAGGAQPATSGHITSKLAPEDGANNTTTPQTTNTGESLEIQFLVVEGFQVGRGAARLDPVDMTRLGCMAGDTILITGSRTTAAKVVP